ncbi:MAG: S-layer homology domain-containing protein [Clostridia bacterium]|nr:S-layer homology domain-containing protein [Clostridia bacterium]
MKKILSLIIAAILSFCSVLPVFADEAKSEIVSGLILSAKEKLKINDDEFVFSDYYQNESKSGNRYNLNWESKDKTKSSSINVEIGENKTIYRYNFNDHTKEYGKIKFPAHNDAEAMTAAKEFFKIIDSEKHAQVIDEKITYEAYENAYIYTAQRAHGNMPVFGNRISVQVDADTLKPTYYYANWDENLTFSESEIISLDKAMSAYKEKIGYELFYQVVAEDYKDTVKLVYRPKYDETLYIDATSGEALNFEQLYGEESAGGSNMYGKAEATADSAAARLSDEELAMLEEISKMLSKEKAESIARRVSEFDITDKYTVSGYNIHKDSHGKYTGRISFELKTDKNDKYGYRNVLIDAKTGEIISFSGYESKDKNDSDSQISDEQAYSLAEKFLKKYYAEKLNKMQKKNVFKSYGAGADYQRTENGIRVYNNGASVYADSSEKIRSFSLNWTDAQFPDAADAAGNEKMYEKLFGDNNLRCGYLIAYDNDGNTKTAKAVYKLEENPVLDAKTLQKLNWQLKPQAEEKKPSYTDISGHYAEDAALKLLAMDIYYPENELRPNDAVTQKDYLKLVSNVVFRYEQDDEDAFYNYLVHRGVLTKEEINAEGTVTRIDAVRYLLNALGYGEFAKIPGIFNCPFDDVTEENKGYGAIAAGLKLVNSETDTFYSSADLKRGDSLIIIYNYLTR